MIQDTIRSYLEGEGEPAPLTLRCFVGMIEGGEATLADFIAVGGASLGRRIVNHWRAISWDSFQLASERGELEIAEGGGS